MAAIPLRLLLVEDSEDDALLVLRTLRHGGFDVKYRRVDTAQAMRQALADEGWDAVTCDYVMPQFSGLAALELLQECGLDLPFIVVSGKIGEETAVEAMKAGAHDYVMKSDLKRLPQAMRRELQDAEERRERRRAEQDLARMHLQMAQAHKEWLQAFDSIDDPVFLHDKSGRIMRANRAYAARADRSFPELIGRAYWEVFPRRDGPLPGCCETMAEAKSEAEEIELEDGRIYASRSSPIKDDSGTYLYSIHVMVDITARKAAERAVARSERYYRKLIEGGSDVFFLLDREGRMRYRSDSGVRVTGWKTEEVLGRNVQMFVPDEHAPLVRRRLAETQANPGKEYRFELPAKRRDGSLVELEIVVKSLCHDPDIDGIVVTARDITERKQSEEALRRLNRSLRTLSAGNEALVHATDEETLLGDLARVIHDVGGYPQCFIAYAIEDAARTMEIKASAGIDIDILHQAQISWGDDERGRHALARAVRTGKPQITRDLADSPEFAPWHEQARTHRMGALCGLPLGIGAARPYGVLAIVASERDAFDAEELRLLQELAGDLAFGIDSLRTRAQRDRIVLEQLKHEEAQRRSLEDSITAIAATIEMRDPYTAGHQRRVARLAGAIARELGLAEDTIHGIEIAASIHDLGKINIPSEILAKPTRLSDIETMLVRNHAQVGYDILKGIRSPWPIATMVLQHHERLDGSGYPHGLKDGAILPEARILAVADVVEAMASHRPYRAALGSKAALAEIARGRGAAFDAQAVDACLKLFAQGRFSLSN